MSERAPKRRRPLLESLPPFPHGWFFLCRSDELPPGGVQSRRLAGSDVVAFRTETGRLAVVEAYCPHLGAHLGHGGTVRGDVLRCPMHGFLFDADGACVRSGYGTRAPPTAKLRRWPAIERHGLILAYHGPPDALPDWEVPDLEMRGWSRLYTRTWEIDSHPQETTENSVDVGHLPIVHGYTDVAMTSPLETSGPYLTASFTFGRRADFLGRRSSLTAYYTVHVHGLGYSHVDATVPAFGIKSRQLVLATPLDPGRVALTIGIQIRESNAAQSIFRPLALVPRQLTANAIARSIFWAFKRDVSQDFRFWENKRYQPRPRLAEGDGPILRYRRWATQFYEDDLVEAPPSEPASVA